jgi:hypothetical protein
MGFVLCCPFFVLLRLPTDDSTGSIVLMCALLALLGASFIMITPPVMAEITFILQGLEEKKPGRFGSNGAYAQGVSHLILCNVDDIAILGLILSSIVWLV